MMMRANDEGDSSTMIASLSYHLVLPSVNLVLIIEHFVRSFFYFLAYVSVVTSC